MKKLRTLIVDDEGLARRGLRLRLEKDPRVELVGECRNGREALAAIPDLGPDLVFLDIQMPGLDGFDVVRNLQGDGMPMVIFVTAFDHYAVKAFEVHAVDYILKPADEELLDRALGRATDRLSERGAVNDKEQLLEVISEITGKSPGEIGSMLRNRGISNRRYPERIAIKEGRNTTLLPINEIDWVDAAGDYMCVHAKGETHVMRITMKELEALFDPGIFQRVHRSTIVNLSRISKVCSHSNGEYHVILENGSRLKISRGYRDRLQNLT